MFAARIDQENLTYDHQRAAAAKPLNQALGAKTPANKAPKTPFRKQLNDENDAFNTGFKTGKKGGETIFMKAGKGAELDKNAFITPAGPRNRAPLGMKTTNAKGGPLKTPAPAKESAQKTLSPRLRRSKVKILHEDAQKVTQEPVVPDIEYMPPRSIPLPDYPDERLDLEEWDELKGANFTNGWYGVHMNPVGHDGLTRTEREMKNLEETANRLDDEEVRKALENDVLDALDIDNLGKHVEGPTSKPANPLRKRAPLTRAPSTLSSRSAASALSRPNSATSSLSAPPRFAAPTANTAARSRAPASAPFSKKSTSSVMAPTAASLRHASATAASRSTLGYSKGRAVSASTRQPLSSIYSKPASSSASTTSSISANHSPAFIKQKNLLESLIADDPELERLLLEKNGRGEYDISTSLEGVHLDDEDDDLKDFQLPLLEE